MLFVPAGFGYGLITPSWGTTRPAAANGTLVTPVTTNGWGTAAQLFSATTADAFGISININTIAGSNSFRPSAIQIGIDEAGGTNYVYRIVNLLCGGASSYIIPGSGIWYYFPMFIPRGSTIAVQARSSTTTAFNVGAILNQELRDPATMRNGTFMQALGVTLGAGTAAGVAVTPGTTAEGAWVTVGTTTRRLWWWQVILQHTTADTAWSAQTYHIDLAVGNATVKDIILTDVVASDDATENFNMLPHGAYYDVPSGSTIYARVQGSSAIDTYTIAAYGMGG